MGDDADTRVLRRSRVDSHATTPASDYEDTRELVEEEVGPPGPVEPPPRRWSDDLGWALLVLLILVLAGLGAWWYFASRGAEKRVVPGVTGVPVATAVNRLQSRGFKARVTTQVHAGRPGIVFAQRPPAGTKLKKGATVQVLASRGPATVRVPNAVGLPEALARDRLVAAGFEVTGARVFSDEKPGTVVAQNPAAGTQEAKDSTVRVNVSKGPGEVIVPNVVGLTLGDSETKLAQVKLKGVVQLEVPSAQPKGTVVAQKPAGGKARVGSVVHLNVSDGTGGTSTAPTDTSGITTTIPTPTG
jgi:serine/threonine-protein kinase